MKHTASPRRCSGVAALFVVVFCWSAAVTPSQSLVSPRIVGLLQYPQHTAATAWTRSSYNQHQQHQPDHPRLGWPSSTRRQSPTPHKDGSSRLYFFRRDNDNNNNSIKDDEKNEEKTSFFDSIFNRGGGRADPQPDDDNNNEKNPTTSTVAEQPTASTTAVVTAQLTPTEQAAKYLSDAERMRLEAERLDAALTLRKIERLERELAAATNASSSNRTKTSSSSPKKDVEQIQREFDVLFQKVKESTDRTNILTATSPEVTTTHGTSTSTTSTVTADTATTTSTLPSAATGSISGTSSSSTRYPPVWPDLIDPYDQELYDDIYNTIKFLPQILLGQMALKVGNMKPTVDPVTGSTSVDPKELADRIDRFNRHDYSLSTKPPPDLSEGQIIAAERRIAAWVEEQKKKKESSWFSRVVSGAGGGGGSGSKLFFDPNFFANEDADATERMLVEELLQDPRLEELQRENPRRFAQFLLETTYYTTSEFDREEEMKVFRTMMEEQPLLKPFVGGDRFNGTIPRTLDVLVYQIYPKCTTKQDKDPAEVKIPTEAQVNQLLTEVLPKANFQASSKPEPVAGGYLIRGSTKFTRGDEFIDKLDSVMERSSLKDKMTVLYQADFSSFGDDDEDTEFNPFEAEGPILYVVSPEICREPKPVQLAVVSGLGLATSWYLSIFPFLLNPALAARVEEQLALADANMTPNLEFLTDLSLPLFATFVGIQLVHELAHLVVAGSNGIKTSVPVFVPSIITGTTSTVTTFKEPVKNKAAMFDFSVSGPLAGMLASCFALVVGSQLSVVMDPATFPALPLEILRQSTLGGGIIEAILGYDVLSIPEGARGTELVNGMTVPLHPVALAGYFGLVVNALALLPIGTTDGGRVALSLFGRLTKGVVGTLALCVLLIVGIAGSDLFLFYFSFCIAFQTGNEVPARNEVDKVDIPRVLLATATYVFAALALTPF